MDRKLGIKRPEMPGWTLNDAVDKLMKNEFDLLREKGQAHELMKQYKIDAVPFQHPELSIWRDDNRKYIGAKVLHKKTNFHICGIVDDIWINKKNDELHIVDYKATSTKSEISLEDKYKQGYKKQMEVYQWIFKQLGFKISETGYFVFANADKNRPKFDGHLEFELSILPHQGDTSWIEPTLLEIKKCLEADNIPDPGPKCGYCRFVEQSNVALQG